MAVTALGQPGTARHHSVMRRPVLVLLSLSIGLCATPGLVNTLWLCLGTACRPVLVLLSLSKGLCATPGLVNTLWLCLGTACHPVLVLLSLSWDGLPPYPRLSVSVHRALGYTWPRFGVHLALLWGTPGLINTLLSLCLGLCSSHHTWSTFFGLSTLGFGWHVVYCQHSFVSLAWDLYDIQYIVNSLVSLLETLYDTP